MITKLTIIKAIVNIIAKNSKKAKKIYEKVFYNIKCSLGRCFTNLELETFEIKKLYSLYIFKSFAKNFFTWATIFFLLLASYNNIDVEPNLFKQLKIITIFSRTLVSFIDTLNIVALISCMIYFLRSKRVFSFLVLGTFGVETKKILKPIIIFLLLVGLTKIIILKPISIKIENMRKTMAHYNSKQRITLKKGIKFTVVDSKNNKNYIIISGTYDRHDFDKMEITNATFQQYEERKLTTIYSTKRAYFENKTWNLTDANKTDIANKTNKKVAKYAINSFLTINEIASEIQNTMKLKKSLYIGLYEHLKLTSNKHKSSIESEALVNARIYLSNEIMSLFCLILSCLIAYLFCISHTRDANMIKSSIECFVVYFIILRIVRATENIVAISFLSTFCVCVVNLLLCIATHLLIIERDCEYSKIEKIKSEMILNYNYIDSLSSKRRSSLMTNTSSSIAEFIFIFLKKISNILSELSCLPSFFPSSPREYRVKLTMVRLFKSSFKHALRFVSIFLNFMHNSLFVLKLSSSGFIFFVKKRIISPY